MKRKLPQPSIGDLPVEVFGEFLDACQPEDIANLFRCSKALCHQFADQFTRRLVYRPCRRSPWGRCWQYARKLRLTNTKLPVTKFPHLTHLEIIVDHLKQYDCLANAPTTLTVMNIHLNQTSENPRWFPSTVIELSVKTVRAFRVETLPPSLITLKLDCADIVPSQWPITLSRLEVDGYCGQLRGTPFPDALKWARFRSHDQIMVPGALSLPDSLEHLDTNMWHGYRLPSKLTTLNFCRYGPVPQGFKLPLTIEELHCSLANLIPITPEYTRLKRVYLHITTYLYSAMRPPQWPDSVEELHLLGSLGTGMFSPYLVDDYLLTLPPRLRLLTTPVAFETRCLPPQGCQVKIVE